MDARAIRAGVGAGVVGLLAGAVLGTYGGWSAVLSLAASDFGFWLVALVLTVVLAYLYGYWFNAFLPGTAVVRGVLFGALLWVVMLILGGVSGFFKDTTYAEPVGTTVFLALLVHVLWGATLGSLYESR